MRIVCPTCSAEYDVPDSLVTAGRLVRCARCGGEWMPVQAGVTEPVTPPVDDPPPVSAEPVAAMALPTSTDGSPVADAPPLASSAMDRLTLPSVRPLSRLPLRLAWLASLAVLVLLGWAAHAWRAEIVVAWPPSARMYAAFGVQPIPGQSP